MAEFISKIVSGARKTYRDMDYNTSSRNALPYVRKIKRIKQYVLLGVGIFLLISSFFVKSFSIEIAFLGGLILIFSGISFLFSRISRR